MAEADEQPVLSVVRGTPDDVELAALAAVLSAIAAARARAAQPSHRPHWSRPRALLRTGISHGPGAWHASGLPG
jgi:acyl-CoA carboxylase epsilon subunit